MNSKYKYLFKNIGILTVSNFASKILVFFLVPLYTSVLTTEEYGIFDIIITSLTFLLPILTLNISDAVMRFVMDKGYDVSSVIKIGIHYITISIIFIIIFLIFNRIFNLVSFIVDIEWFVLLYFVFHTFQSFLTQLSKGLEKVKVMGIAGVLSTIVLIISNVYFLLFAKLGLKGFLIANILGSCIPTIYYIFNINFLGYIKIDKDVVLKKKMLKYCIPLILVVIGWTINHSLDKYIVTVYYGLSVSGLLAIAYKIPNILNVLQNIFVQAWQISAISEYEKENSEEFYKKTFEYVVTIMIIGCALLIILTKPIAKLLYAKEFYEAWRYVPFLIISAMFNILGGFLGPILSAKYNTIAMAKSALYGIITNIILNFALIKVLGVQGVVIATAISSFIIFYNRKIAIMEIISKNKEKKIYLSFVILTSLAIVIICDKDIVVSIPFLIAIFLLNVTSIVNISVTLIKSIKKVENIKKNFI